MNIIKIWVLGVLIFSIIFSSWIIPVIAEDYTNKLKVECIEQYIQFTYIDLQSGTLSEIEKIGFANYWFDNCFDLDYDMTSGDFMEWVNDYLAQHNDTKVISD